jgi:hypothetical protein
LTRDIMRKNGLTAAEAISQYKKGSVVRVFPGQYYESTIDEIESGAASGDQAARTALKLLFDKRFDK